MSNPQQRIEIEVRSALKAQQKTELSTLRMLLNSIKNEQINTGNEVDEAVFQTLVRRSIKQRQDSIEQYRKGGRDDLADKEEQEAEILKKYLPPQTGDEEISEAIRTYVHDEKLSGPQALGPVIKAMLERFGDTTDGATVSRLAREILNEDS